MSISSIGSSANQSIYGPQRAPSASAAASTGAASGAPASNESSSTVTLSPDAQAFAKFNSEGITVELVSAAGVPNLMNPAGYAQQVAAAKASGATSPADGKLSEANFNSMLDSSWSGRKLISNLLPSRARTWRGRLFSVMTGSLL